MRTYRFTKSGVVFGVVTDSMNRVISSAPISKADRVGFPAVIESWRGAKIECLMEIEQPKLAIVGSRRWGDRDAIKRFVDTIPEGVTVISGGAAGVDTFGVLLAARRGLAVEQIPAEWDKYGKSAGYRRNVDLVEAADFVVAFSYQRSKGTEHTIDITRSARKPIRIFRA